MKSSHLWLVFCLVFVSLQNVVGEEPPETDPVVFRLNWANSHDRHFLGSNLWGNRLHDWKVVNGRLECVTDSARLGMRTAHLISHQLSEKLQAFQMEVETGLVGDADGVSNTSSAGFLVGAGGSGVDHRSALLVHQWAGPGGGIYAGVTSDGRAFFKDFSSHKAANKSKHPVNALPRDKWKIVSVDSVEPGNKAEHILDGDPSTIWHTEWQNKKPKHPHEVVIDMGEVQKVSGFGYLPRQGQTAGRILKYEFLLSANGKEWELVKAGTLSNNDLLATVDFPPTSARFLKLRALSAHFDRPSTTVAELYALGDQKKAQQPILPPTTLEHTPTPAKHFKLKLFYGHMDHGIYILQLTVTDLKGKLISKATMVPRDNNVIGNVALVSHPGTGKTGRFWFQNWQATGKKWQETPDSEFGPIVCTQYTLSRNVLKLTAQLMPISEQNGKAVFLDLKDGDDWKEIAKSEVIIPGYTAPFRIPNWDSTQTVQYRVRYMEHHKNGLKTESYWRGTIKRDPVSKNQLVVAGFTGNHMNGHTIGSPNTNWKTDIWFPHADLTKQVIKHKPDVLFFSGDQVYEGRSPTFADTNPNNIKLDYLYKWYLWCWSYRHLTANRPTITIPDDHDVYQGNIWGQGGRKSPGRDHDGGFVHPADFVKMVERTQTSHLPDPFDPTPVDQGIGVYYSSMNYGRISFAILEDRKFKSGCRRPDMPPSGTGRPDHFNDPKFDINKLDIPTVKLLGDRQLSFLNSWVKDWEGVDMKMAVSQTIFANMATHHGPGLDYLIADLDSNGWPQTGRNKAIDALRRGYAFHLAGDQHLATIVHHGIDTHGDGIWSFCVPSVANFYPRAWAPESAGPYKYPAPINFTGKRHDGFGHPVIVHAATNPGKDMGHKPKMLHNGMPGYGIVKLNKKWRSIRMECWPRYADPDNPKHAPYPGWPMTIKQTDNYDRKPVGFLPTITVKGMTDPVVEVTNEADDSHVYSLRIKGESFRPRVFQKGKYTVRIGEPGTTNWKTLKGVVSTADPNAALTVEFASE